MSADSSTKLKKALDSIERFELALNRLEEILHTHISQEAILRDATIQRFEFVVELCWKSLKRCLLVEGLEAFTPKETLKLAFQSHWIDQESLWLTMLDDRNLMSHIYQEEQAIAIYKRIPGYLPELQRLLQFLKTRFPQ